MHVFEVIHNRGSTNMDLSRDDEGATQDRSNAPITTPHDPEQVKLVLESLLKVSTLHLRSVKQSAVASSSEKCARRSLVEPSDRQARIC